MTQDMTRAMVDGNMSRGGRRKALFAIVTNALVVSPARESFSGFSAQT